MQTINHTITTTLCSALAMLAGACDDELAASGPEITLYQSATEGGTTNQALWSVSIQRMGAEGPHWCSGTIIADSWILTAAHCVEDKPVASLQVLAGFGETAPEPLLRGVERIVMHPNYARHRLGHDHDLALLRLSAPLDVAGGGLATIELGAPADLEPTSSGVMGLVNGRLSSDEGSDALQVVAVELFSNAEVRASYRTPISLEQIASKPMDGATCQADGGSPLVLETSYGPRLVGVASEGTGCAKPSSLQIYARVSAYLEWIDGELREP